MSKLRDAQSRFSWSLAKLILYAYAAGYEITMARVWEDPEHNKKSGGIPGSLHTLRLAADLNLFRAGKYLTRTEDYEILGAWWEAQGPDYAWGGRFKKKDGNHFSISWGGVK